MAIAKKALAKTETVVAKALLVLAGQAALCRGYHSGWRQPWGRAAGLVHYFELLAAEYPRPTL